MTTTTGTIATVPPSSGRASDKFGMPLGYRSEEAVRWTHVLTHMGVTCDPSDEPTSYQLLPEFGDGNGTAYYCGPYTRETWPSYYVVSACALRAAGQCRRVIFLGNIAVPCPNIWIVSPPTPEIVWEATPFRPLPPAARTRRQTEQPGFGPPFGRLSPELTEPRDFCIRRWCLAVGLPAEPANGVASTSGRPEAACGSFVAGSSAGWPGCHSALV